MRYLLDANVLIDAARNYYPMDRVPEFWDWLLHVAEGGHVNVPQEPFDEVAQGRDGLVDWLKSNKDLLLSNTEVVPRLVLHVVVQGYARDLDDAEIEKLGADPFLVAHALAEPGAITVVTMEASRPNRTRANRHLPDVCRALGVPCINTFELVRRLDFRTNWVAS